MHTSSPYRPLKTIERTAPVSDDVLSRHRNALFELLRVDSYEKRAEALVQIGSNLIAWTKLAYPEEQTPNLSRQSSHELQRDVRPSQARRMPSDSNEGVFDLDGLDTWSDQNSTRRPSSTSPALGVRPQTPPWSGKLTPYQEPGYGDYSMYGVDSNIFNKTRPTSELKEILKSYLLNVLRASVDCPFADVRRYCRYILRKLHDMGASVPELICEGPSWLIPAVETIAFGHDATSEQPKDGDADDGSASDGRTRSSWVSSSFHSDTSDPGTKTGPIKRSRSGILTPGQSPTEDLNDLPTEHDSSSVVFRSDDEDEEDSTDRRSSNGTQDSTKMTAASAIPINGSKKAPRVPIDSTDIDNILLGPVETRGDTRKTRFSLSGDSPRSSNRPALGRKRTNSNVFTLHQKRANHNLRAFHVNCYFSTGRISNYGKLLSYFPRFYESTVVLHDELIRKQGGPLQRLTKLYLSILAAAQCNCQYLISYFTKKFLQLGQNLEWLEGLHRAPRKIQRLSKITAFLCHQPWRIERHHLDDLLSRSKESLERGEPSDQWTMGELVQVICTLIVVNCQAHFCLSVGLVPEPDTFGGACIRRQRKPSMTTTTRQKYGSVNVLPLFTSYDSRTFASPASYDPVYGHSHDESDESTPCIVLPTRSDLSTSATASPAEVEEDTIPNRLWKRRQSFNQAKLWAPKEQPDDKYGSGGGDLSLSGIFAQCGLVDEEDGGGGGGSTTTRRRSPVPDLPRIDLGTVRKSPGTNGLLAPTEQTEDARDQSDLPVNPILEDIARFCDATERAAVGGGNGGGLFDLQDPTYAVLRLADCNWEDHTCSLIGRFVPSLELVLDANLQEARDAAGDDDDGFFFPSGPNGVHVDQGPLREAVWFFILRLYGIYNDGYDYGDVMLLLNRSAKRFLRRICHSPDRLTRREWQALGKGLRPQEKVLLALLATHARMAACLIYAFRYFNNT